MRPVLGSLIVVLSSVMAAVSSSIFLFAESRLSLVSLRSLSHQFFWSASASPSFSMRPSIFSISSRTVLKGLLAWSMAMMRPKSGEEPFTSSAACRKPMALLRGSSFEASAPAAAESWRCLRMVLFFWKNCAPVEVADTEPKVAKAASLFKIAMASDRAASSWVRKSTRFSYCFFLDAHISKSFAKKSSASAFWDSAASSWVLFDDKSSSLSDRRPCFVLYADSISSNALTMSAMYLSYAVWARFSASRAEAKFASKVSFMSFRMPTTSPERAL
mmetsp:Transcript_173107/g.555077  ORF Transcript_173107/g.555077 Transcript_173107/m.555077 type:complete len:274 (-) Transcript_173107:692-1513(-)